MNEDHFDVIVIGAGPGGTTVASLLAKCRKKVLLVDKNRSVGGRMSTFQKDGFHYELFPINCVPATHSRYEELSSILGKQDEVKLIISKEFGNIGKIYYQDKKGKIRAWDMRSSSFKMLGALGVKLWDVAGINRTIRFLSTLAALPAGEMEKLQNISALDYVNSCGELPDGIYTYFLATFAEGVYEMTSDKVPAAEMIRAFQTTVKDGGGRYYEGGIGHFFEVMAQTVMENGGKLLLNTRVKKIDLENGRVSGITTSNDKKYFAPVVISSAGVRQTAIKLVGEQYFDESYIQKLKKLENNLACVGYRYFTDAVVLKDVMRVYFPYGCIGTYEEFEKMHSGEAKPVNNYIYIGTTSLYPTMAPEGKQLIYACMSCLSDPKIDTKPYLDYVEKMVKVICPEILDHVERREVMSPATVLAVGNDSIFEGQGGESYGIAMSLGQSGKKRPGAKSPVKGLYYVGNDVEGVGLGTHMAVDSGFKVFEIVNKVEFGSEV
jgi:phytoene dehydrogenase-like protein